MKYGKDSQRQLELELRGSARAGAFSDELRSLEKARALLGRHAR
ncbi:MAG TPA: hypothetical protein VER04_17365 [Polyangiaceae bacterium]|nr:hypothetical protein [Polyangiaceae bacterium]